MHSRSPFALWAAVLLVGILAASSIEPVRAAVESLFSCASTSACLEWDNSGAGPAIKGVSTGGNGVSGQTKFKSLGKTAGTAGVVGTDLSTSGNLDAGVSGVSKNGTGVIGTSTAYNGMQGLSAAAGASGVYGQNSTSSGFGVAGRITATAKGSGAGVYAVAATPITRYSPDQRPPIRSTHTPTKQHRSPQTRAQTTIVRS